MYDTYFLFVDIVMFRPECSFEAGCSLPFLNYYFARRNSVPFPSDIFVYIHLLFVDIVMFRPECSFEAGCSHPFLKYYFARPCSVFFLMVSL